MKTCFLILTLLLVGASMDSGTHAATLEAIQSALPQQVMGWAKAEEDRYFDDRTIFEYIDGAGELYRAYHMKRCLSRRYTTPNGPAIILDIFDMGTSKDAFGVFTHDQDGEPLDMGQGALYRAGWLSFWKDRYFASLYGEQETEAARAAIREIAGRLALIIKEEGPKPFILSYLPPRGLQSKSIRYFHDHHILNFHYYLSDENILNLGPQTEATLAEYRLDHGSCRLLLALYPDAEKAAKARSSLFKTYLHDADRKGFARLEDGRWSGAAVKGSLIIVVLEADSREVAEELLKRATKSAPATR
ncbi:MAG: DUF6599 family protein [Pseudomonadota bacterium]